MGSDSTADANVLVIGHRGAAGLWPANTLLGFERAAGAGCDLVELDVRLSADGVPVCIHDPTVDARSGTSGRVDEFTLEQLKALDGAYNWRPERGDVSGDREPPYRGEGLEIPTLAEVFETLPETRFLVEIKPEVDDFEAVCAAIQKYGLEERTIVTSFSRRLGRFRECCPEIPTAAHQLEVGRFVLASRLGPGRWGTPDADALAVPRSRYGVPILTRGFVETAHERGLDLYAWTIDDPGEMARLVELGVDGLVTDRPDLAREVLERGENG